MQKTEHYRVQANKMINYPNSKAKNSQFLSLNFVGVLMSKPERFVVCAKRELETFAEQSKQNVLL